VTREESGRKASERGACIAQRTMRGMLGDKEKKKKKEARKKEEGVKVGSGDRGGRYWVMKCHS